MNTMIEVLGWNVGVGVWSLQTLVLWSVLFGFASTLVGTVQTSYHWLWTAAAALVGGGSAASG